MKTAQEGRARVLRRTRHVGHPALADRDLPVRGRRVLRRPGPGRGADPGPRQGARAPARRRVHIRDLREEFVRDFVFPMLRANAVYEGTYLMGTSIARPLIAKAPGGGGPSRRARTRSATAPPARATTRSASSSPTPPSAPDLTVIAPWREWDLDSRTALMDFAKRHDIPVPVTRRAAVLDGPQPVPHLATRAASSRTRGPSRRRRCSS